MHNASLPDDLLFDLGLTKSLSCNCLHIPLAQNDDAVPPLATRCWVQGKSDCAELLEKTPPMSLWSQYM